MKVIRSIRSMQKFSRAAVAGKKTIALVPTMGYLHEGHLSLVSRAAQAGRRGGGDDIRQPGAVSGRRRTWRGIPGTNRGILPKIESALGGKSKQAGRAAVFVPKVEDIYPDDFQTWVTVEKLTQVLEGKKRPTHFRGVTTVVAKLF